MKIIIRVLLSFTIVALISLSAMGTPVQNNDSTENLSSRRGEFFPPQDLFNLDELDLAAHAEVSANAHTLKKVKFYLLNGEFKFAKVYLEKLASNKTKIRPLVYRYLGAISFVEGNFNKSYQYLNDPQLRIIPNYSKVCTLKVINEIILNMTDKLKNDWEKCQLENQNRFKKNLVWMDTLIQLKLEPKKGITKAPFKMVHLQNLDNNELKLLLKFALYLNQEKLVIDKLTFLTMDQLQDPEVREIVGQFFFRQGHFVKSYQFIEDLKSPNAENIKGNLYILRNKYELAYAQFKLALEQKMNSQNAMERLLPLAWLLGDWEGGTKYAYQVIASPQTQINKLALIAAFLIQKGDFEKSTNVLEQISESSKRGADIDVAQLYSFASLMLNKEKELIKFANLSCTQFDLLNCWILFQINQWAAFPMTVRRNDSISHKKEWEKLTKEEINQPLKETVYINQIDIEEMDDKLIKLIPKSTQ